MSEKTVCDICNEYLPGHGIDSGSTGWIISEFPCDSWVRGRHICFNCLPRNCFDVPLWPYIRDRWLSKKAKK